MGEIPINIKLTSLVPSLSVPSLSQDVVRSAQQHSVTRLLVDLSGNPGGFVDLAYLFVRCLHPLLQRSGHGDGKYWTIDEHIAAMVM